MTSSPEKKERRENRLVGILITLIAAAVLVAATVSVLNHFTGQANHRQGQTEIQVLQEQATFAAYLIEALDVNHNIACQAWMSAPATKDKPCPQLPPLPKSLSQALNPSNGTTP